MGRNQPNKAAVRTRQAISDTFLSLIRERAYEDISVTDICRHADVVRKTFYNHFHSKDDVVRGLINGIFHEMESRVDLLQMSVRQILLISFEYVLENREALILFYNRGLIRFAHKSISAYITKDHILTRMDEKIVDARAYKYIAAQISAVLISVIETWIENGLEDSIEFLAELTESLMYKPNDPTMC